MFVDLKDVELQGPLLLMKQIKLAKKAEPVTEGGILIPQESTADLPDNMLAFEIVKVGSPGIDQKGIERQTDLKVGDKVLCHMGVSQLAQTCGILYYVCEFSNIMGKITNDVPAE